MSATDAVEITNEDEAGEAGPAGIGAIFDLSPGDADLLEDFCRRLLRDVGIDGRQFFQRLQAGESMGAALGLPAGITELLYSRAYRWFGVGRADRAEPLFRALCVAEGSVADYWVGLGICLRIREDLEGAGLAFATAARMRPGWAVPAFHACELAIRAGDLDVAAEQIARFHATADDTTPERMHAEIARMSKALDMRRGSKA